MLYVADFGLEVKQMAILIVHNLNDIVCCQSTSVRSIDTQNDLAMHIIMYNCNNKSALLLLTYLM